MWRAPPGSPPPRRGAAPGRRHPRLRRAAGARRRRRRSQQSHRRHHRRQPHHDGQGRRPARRPGPGRAGPQPGRPALLPAHPDPGGRRRGPALASARRGPRGGAHRRLLARASARSCGSCCSSARRASWRPRRPEPLLESLGFLITRAHLRMHRDFSDGAGAAATSCRATFGLLTTLATLGPVPQAELGRRLGVSGASVVAARRRPRGGAAWSSDAASSGTGARRCCTCCRGRPRSLPEARPRGQATLADRLGTSARGEVQRLVRLLQRFVTGGEHACRHSGLTRPSGSTSSSDSSSTPATGDGLHLRPGQRPRAAGRCAARRRGAPSG